MSKKKQEATDRERRLVKGLLGGQPMKQAATDAGYAPSSATSNAYLIIDRPRVRSLITESLERAGLTSDTLAAPLVAALSARVRIMNSRTLEAAEVDLPDHTIRLAAVDRICAMYGYVPKRIELPDPPKPGLVVHIHQQKDPQKVCEPVNDPVCQDEDLTIRITKREE